MYKRQVSDNARSWYDNRNAEAYGYRPQDQSELYANAVLAKEAPTDPASPDETYQGGTFVLSEGSRSPK